MSILDNKRNRRDGKSKWVWRLIPILKYGFSFLITLMAARSVSDWRILAMGLVELGFIWTLSNALLNVMPPLGHIVHFLLLLVYNAQMLVKRFGNSFITQLMLANLASVEDLSGNFLTYLPLLVILLVILLLPMPVLHMKRQRLLATLGVAVGVWLCALAVIGPASSPLAGLGRLSKEAVDYHRLRTGLQSQTEADVTPFVRQGVDDYRPKPQALPERPNIVLVFVEGLSQSVIEDERGIMPNLASLEKRSLFFRNYYNHTFATYRGLIGQLYSGHQFSDRDANRLISLHALLHEVGYHTNFFNTEPNNADFSRYLEAMSFDTFVSKSDWVTQAYTTLNYITDRDAYDRLYDMLLEQHESGQPFFTAMYSFGTHVSLDSPDEKYGDGSNPELNKFYNLDVQIGRFMERFEGSALAEDTIVVITADHATYADAAFTDTFPDYPRRNMEMDRIPLIFYYRGIQAEKLNVKGRNSLDMAPTLLDYLDLSGANMFLGDSLFRPASGKDEPLPFDRFFFDGSTVDKTGLQQKKKIKKSERVAMMDRIMAYLAVSIPQDQGFRERDIDIRQSENRSQLLIASRCDVPDGAYLWFLVWGRPSWQNDVHNYRGNLDEEGLWRCTVPLSEHGETGIYYVHAYVGDSQSPDLSQPVLIMKNCYVSAIGAD